MLWLASLIILGIVSGFAAGLLGIGGGMLMVPLLTMAFTYGGLPEEAIVHMAIATSLSVIFFTSMASVYAHNKKKAVLWHIAFLLVPGVVIGAWIGPAIAAQLDTQWLAGLFGLFVIFSGYKMVRAKKRTERDAELPGPALMSGAGLGIGVLSGLVGAGGGFITVPFLTWRGVRIHNAVGTSAVMGFPIALFGTLSNMYQGLNVPGLPPGSIGYIYLPAVALVAASSMILAPVGARTAHRMNVLTLRRVFGGMLLLLAAYMFYKAATVG